MPELVPIEPAAHIMSIDYAVRGELDKIAKRLSAEGKRTLNLNIGDPKKLGKHPTPPELIDIIVEKLESGDCLGYGDEMGEPELRQIIAENTRKDILGLNNKPITKEDVYIGNGSTELVTFCIEGLLNIGEGILLPDPGYPLYESVIKKVHGEPQFYSLNRGNWGIDFSNLERKISENTRAIVIINPGNPTGKNYKKKNLQNLRKFADKHKLVIFADEVYSYLGFYGGYHTSIAKLEGDYPVITFGSLSKNYLSPGLRVGWMIRTDPNGLTKKYWEAAINKLAGIRLSSSPLLQYALKPAFTERKAKAHIVMKKEVESFNNELKKKADLTYEMLNHEKAGISCVRPQAAFYAFPKIDLPEGVTDFDFAKDLLIHTGVYVNNGSGFGPNSKGHIRVVFLPEYNLLKEAYDKIIDFKMNFKENGKPKYMAR